MIPASAPVLFLRRARERPEAVAVSEADGRRTSYAELLALASGAAGLLRDHGVPAGSVVGIRSAPCAAVLAAQLGIWLHGGVPLLIDPAQPLARAETMIADAGPAALFTAEPSGLGGVLEIDLSRLSPRGDSRRFRGTRPDAPAYLLYTSGSTGRPKGVLVGHASFARLIDWHIRTYAVAPGDTASSVAAPSFDAFQWETWPYLCAGARVCFAPPELRYAPWELGSWFSAEKVDLAFLPTPLAEAYVRRGSSYDQLRCLLTGGDRLRLADGHPLRRLVNHYGPTEGTVLATFHDVQPAESGAIPIGRPIPSATTLVLDEDDRRTPPGEPGELVLGGDCLALGYWREENARSPFTSLRGRPGRWYRTGDLVRRDSTGVLHFLARLDRQLKVRGMRVEPGEIEAVLRSHPLLDDAVVTADPAAGRLLAFLVTREPAVDENAVRAFAAGRLPREMVPAVFHLVPELPLTAHGKVDLAALHEPV
ncbi:hypothetical protein Aph01nite_35980 [Acrocarpospora phusangensis]|uniref:D-alanine--poly(Phosphoribitol) ligase n=1 Tax=Acrocarpospora phusangensis TaxID=1070424 RepID=A0A919QD72_9ACTN|nr:amino acid adenylation domain-containing protein [Acrocarpospora phusangensis]GIH25288.1 hypothetical protein Aph01nite_35980 [Acrocarpospora phusangensis]